MNIIFKQNKRVALGEVCQLVLFLPLVSGSDPACTYKVLLMSDIKAKTGLFPLTTLLFTSWQIHFLHYPFPGIELNAQKVKEQTEVLDHHPREQALKTTDVARDGASCL